METPIDRYIDGDIENGERKNIQQNQKKNTHFFLSIRFVLQLNRFRTNKDDKRDVRMRREPVQYKCKNQTKIFFLTLEDIERNLWPTRSGRWFVFKRKSKYYRNSVRRSKWTLSYFCLWKMDKFQKMYFERIEKTTPEQIDNK